MTWKAMAAEQACDVLDFWLQASWPLTRDEVVGLAGELGWTADSEGTLSNPADGLSQPAVRAVDDLNGDFASMNFWLTDVIKDPSAEDEAFLNDRYTLFVREGKKRWGSPKLGRDALPSATWHTGGARITIGRSRRAVTAEFITPQYAVVLQKLGE